jgi:hypothetical protein
MTGSTRVPEYIRAHPPGMLMTDWNLVVFSYPKLFLFLVAKFAIAYIMTKFTEPLRLGFTLVTVPTIARWVGRKKAEREEREDREEKEEEEREKKDKNNS